VLSFLLCIMLPALVCLGGKMRGWSLLPLPEAQPAGGQVGKLAKSARGTAGRTMAPR
jgi:hypothetical protein